MNVFTQSLLTIKKMIVYSPPDTPSPFVLSEEAPLDPPSMEQTAPTGGAEELATLLRCARQVATVMENVLSALSQGAEQQQLLKCRQEMELLEQRQDELTPVLLRYAQTDSPLNRRVSTSVAENEHQLKALYYFPENRDLVIRNFTIPFAPPIHACLACIEGLVDIRIINWTVLQPLMLLKDSPKGAQGKPVAAQLVYHCLPSNEVRIVATLREVVNGMNLGDTVLFLDGEDQAVLVNSKGQEHRNVDRPLMEQSVRGSQIAFTETLRVNTALIRSMLRTNDLITHLSTVGRRSPSLYALMYLKSVANPALIREAKRRLEHIAVDHVGTSGMLQALLIDDPLLTYPQMLVTERPDRVVAALLEGRLAILLDSSPSAIVAPISLFSLFHSAEDVSLSSQAASFGRLLRVSGALLALLLPAVYIAATYYHPGAIPTELLLAIAGSREKVPIPAAVEIVVMECAFGLLREAGLRIPGMLGNAIGIVGAIILGQTAVAAGIVSPITVIIIAATGLASFSIPDYSLAYAILLSRFALEALGVSLGLVGVACGLLLLTVILTSAKSLGVPYLIPIAPRTKAGDDVILRGPEHSQELRPDALNPLDQRRQATVSRTWRKQPPVNKEEPT